MYTVYKVTNSINGKYYFGVHKTKNINDSYLGSGLAIKRAIKSYGRENFFKEIIACFDDSISAFNYEKGLISEHIGNPNCYNLMEGGKGGFDHINNNPNRVNPMLIQEYKERNKQSSKKRLLEDAEWAERKRKISIENAKKASLSNTGKKRPEHSRLMSQKSSLFNLMKDKDKFRDLLSSHFEVISPDGIVYNTNRLEDFCKERNLGYGALWNTSRTGKTVIKGKSKGWLCRKT